MTDSVLPPPYIFVPTGASTGEWRRRGVASLPDILGPVTLPPPSNLNPALVFELEPLRPALKQSSRIVTVHAFVTGMHGGDVYANNNTWWNNRLPGGSTRESDGDWLMRDKPHDPWEGRRPRPNSGGVNWAVLDWAWQIQQAIDAGIDGWWVDWLNLNDYGEGDQRTAQVRDILAAADRAAPGGGFPVAAMIDGNTSIGQPQNMDKLLVKTKLLYSSPAAWRLPDGRPLIPVYMPEGSGQSDHRATPAVVRSHYGTYKSRLLAEQGLDAALWFCNQRGTRNGSSLIPGWADTSITGEQGYASALNDIAYGHGQWGTGDPEATLSTSNAAAGAIAYCHSTFGKPYVQPVRPQDSRPNQNKYYESQGFGQWLAAWQVAIDNGADAVQIPTWSDYPEGAHIGPSRNHGWVWLDTGAYYLTRYKLGAWPTIVRDGLYLAHRIHPSTGYTNQAVNDLASPPTAIPAQVRNGTTAAADIVDVLAFLTNTDGTEIRITVGGTTVTRTPSEAYKAFGGPGVYRFSVPLVPGPPPQAEIVRGGVSIAVAASSWPVTTTPIVQDMHYRCVSSLRQKVGNPA